MLNWIKTVIILPLFFALSGAFALQPDTLPIQIRVPQIPQVIEIIDDPATTTIANEIIVEKGGEDFNCSCVSYFRFKAPEISKTIPITATAAEISATQEEPKIGGAVLWKPTELSPLGHISYIEEIIGDKLRISEHNFEPCKTTERWVDVGNPNIKGYR